MSDTQRSLARLILPLSEALQALALAQQAESREVAQQHFENCERQLRQIGETIRKALPETQDH